MYACPALCKGGSIRGDMLAFFTADGRGTADLLLHALAGRLQAEGMRLAGAVQVNVERPDRPRCDMELRLLSGTATIGISQNLGRGSRGCRLDADGLERAVAMVEATLDGPTDLVIVNKFGKQEAEGGGFRPVFARALAEGIPLLTATNRANRAAFVDFAGGLAQELPAEPDRLAAWCRAALGARGRVGAR